jgi:small subunit ribosomal protein S17
MAENSTYKKVLTGKVVSDKNKNTIIVKVSRKFKDAVYSKFVNTSKKYHAHDELSSAKLGDTVSIIESRPYSKMKKWKLLKIN